MLARTVIYPYLCTVRSRFRKHLVLSASSRLTAPWAPGIAAGAMRAAPTAASRPRAPDGRPAAVHTAGNARGQYIKQKTHNRDNLRVRELTDIVIQSLMDGSEPSRRVLRYGVAHFVRPTIRGRQSESPMCRPSVGCTTEGDAPHRRTVGPLSVG